MDKQSLRSLRKKIVCHVTKTSSYGNHSQWHLTSADQTKHRTQSETVSVEQTALLAKWLRSPPQERKIWGSNQFAPGFSGSSHTSDLKIGTAVATLCGVMGSVLGMVGPVSV